MTTNTNQTANPLHAAAIDQVRFIDAWPEELQRLCAAGEWAEWLKQTSTLRYVIDRAERAVVAAMRSDGATWAQVGAALDVSPQAAHKRFS